MTNIPADAKRKSLTFFAMNGITPMKDNQMNVDGEEFTPIPMRWEDFKGFLETDRIVLDLFGPTTFIRDGKLYQVDHLAIPRVDSHDGERK